MSAPSPRPPAATSALIVGAGIGGLTLALALRRAGIAVHLVEQAERLEEVGAGLQLTPNATRILRDLGVLPRLEEVAVAPGALEVRDARSNALLARAPYAPAVERFGAPFLVIHRADLQARLAEAAFAAGASLELGARLQGIETKGDKACAYLGDGSERTADILVAADGVRSAARGHLGIKALPVFSRRLAYRTTVPASEPEAVVRLYLGENAHLVAYPVRSGQALNVVAIVHETRRVERWNEPGEAATVHAAFASWSKEVRDLLARAPSFTCWGLYDIDPLPRWGEGRATLLGDAAHAMLPFLAQGAAQAMEDAAVLTSCLHSEETPEAALRAYEHKRRARTERVQAEARRNGLVYHASGPVRLARNAVIRLTGRGLLDRYAWLYGV